MASVYRCFTPMSVSVYFGKSSFNLALHFCNGIWISFSTLDKHHLAQPATVVKDRIAMIGQIFNGPDALYWPLQLLNVICLWRNFQPV